MRTRTTSVMSLLLGTALAFAAAGCGGGAADGAAPDPTTEESSSAGLGGSRGADPGPSAGTPGGAESGAGGGAGGGGGQPPQYPATARAYAEATVAAYASGQVARLRELTSDGAGDDLGGLPAALKTDWLVLTCDGTAGSHYCAARNGDGDVLTLRVSSQRIGGADAVVDVAANLTTYPGDGEAYARAFVLAWQARNTPRMRALGTPGVVTNLNTDHPAPAGAYQANLTTAHGGAGLLLVTAPDGAGGTFTLHVGTTLLGKAHAVVGYQP